MAYLLDANIFIQAKNLYYGFDVCPGFWDWLDDAHADGRVTSIDRIGDELTGAGDELATWARSRCCGRSTRGSCLTDDTRRAGVDLVCRFVSRSTARPGGQCDLCVTFHFYDAASAEVWHAALEGRAAVSAGGQQGPLRGWPTLLAWRPQRGEGTLLVRRASCPSMLGQHPAYGRHNEDASCVLCMTLAARPATDLMCGSCLTAALVASPAPWTSAVTPSATVRPAVWLAMAGPPVPSTH